MNTTRTQARNREVGRDILLTPLQNVQAFMYDINHNQTEVAAWVTAYLAAYPDTVPLLHSVLQTTEPSSLPAPPAHTVGLDAVAATDESSSSDETPSSGNPPAKRRRRGRPDKAYKRSIAIANRLPQELGSANVLSELQRDLRRERARTNRNAQQRQCANPELRSQSEEEAGNRSENSEDDDLNLQRSPRFETAVERYRRILIAQRYLSALHNKEKGTCSVAEDFARKYLPGTSEEGLSNKKLRDKWKPIIHQHQFWEQLATSCGGAGVLLLLPEEFHNEHARRLRSDDRAALFASIAARHRNLKDDVKVLTDLLSYYFSQNGLPEWQIPLENLPKANIGAWRQRGLRELVGFVTASA